MALDHGVDGLEAPYHEPYGGAYASFGSADAQRAPRCAAATAPVVPVALGGTFDGMNDDDGDMAQEDVMPRDSAHAEGHSLSHELIEGLAAGAMADAEAVRAASPKFATYFGADFLQQAGGTAAPGEKADGPLTEYVPFGEAEHDVVMAPTNASTLQTDGTPP